MAVIDGYTSFLGLEDGLALRLALKVHKIPWTRGYFLNGRIGTAKVHRNPISKVSTKLRLNDPSYTPH